MRRIALPLICVAVAGVAATAATARTAVIFVVKTGPTAPLATGLGDPVFQGPQATTAYAMARNAGATYARLLVYWNSIAPKTLPASGFVATDPASPYYHWSSLDASVTAANAAGITPILDIVGTPSWAYNVQPGAWTGGSPKLGALGAFATAIAKHYDGSSPAAHVFSVWNEPNYNKNLYPQSGNLYRSMVNEVSDSVHAVDPADLVAAGELAPFKHTPSTRDRNHAIPPLAFMNQMLCLSNTTPVHLTCHTPAKFDIWTHHPYSDTGPYGQALDIGGVELGDLPRMTKLLQTAVQLGAIVSAKPLQFWVTEVGWSSNPPNKRGAPIALETRWVAESMYQMWKSGVTVGTWFLLQDQPISTSFQSGLYFGSASLAGAVAKPLLTPFRFPFVAYLLPHGKVKIWGRDTTSDVQNVTIQQLAIPGQPWKTVATVTANSHGIFQATLPLGATEWSRIRASAPGSGTSAQFSLGVPTNENMTVVPFSPN
jgi:hypothetical protein